MSAPGWYPDPGGLPGVLRYWDGQSWSAATMPVPPGAAGPATAPAPSANRSAPPLPPRRSRALGWGLAAVAAVVVLIVVAVVAVRSLGGLVSGGTPGSDPSGGPVCPAASAPSSSTAPTSGDRVVSGRLSYPLLGAPFSGVRSDARTPFGRDVRTQSATVEEVSQGLWVAQVLIARLLAGDGFYGPQQGASIVASCVIGKFYWDYPVAREDRRNTATTVDGRDAWIIEMHLTFDIPDLKTKGETATIVVVDTGDGEAGLFYSSIPDTSPQYDRPAADALRQLQVS